MFLCLDSMVQLKSQTGKDPQKLVYGYINGKKTDCMSEYELRTKLSQDFFNRDNKSGQVNKKQLQRDAIYRGNKNLANADLRGMDLQDLDLSGADLQNALLESADLRGAKLRNANLKGANLENAYCKNADLYRADLTGAQLRGAFFHHANLLETEGLTMENLCTVASLYKALLEEPVLEIIQSKYPIKMKNPKSGWNQKVFSEQPEIPVSEQADPRQFH